MYVDSAWVLPSCSVSSMKAPPAVAKHKCQSAVTVKVTLISWSIRMAMYHQKAGSSVADLHRLRCDQYLIR